MKNFNFVRLFANNSISSTSKASQKRRRGRTCRIEELESREMLSVSVGDFAVIKSDYADLNLKNFGDYTVYEVGGDVVGADQKLFDFSAAGLQSAINDAASTKKSTLIVVRTNDTAQSTLTLTGAALGININAKKYGSVIIVSLGVDGTVKDNLTIDADGKSHVVDVAKGSTVALAGLTITNGSGHGYDYNTGDYAIAGGINNAGALTVTKCVIAGNAGTGIGVGMEKAAVTVTVLNSTIENFLVSFDC